MLPQQPACAEAVIATTAASDKNKRIHILLKDKNSQTPRSLPDRHASVRKFSSLHLKQRSHPRLDHPVNTSYPLKPFYSLFPHAINCAIQHPEKKRIKCDSTANGSFWQHFNDRHGPARKDLLKRLQSIFRLRILRNRSNSGGKANVITLVGVSSIIQKL